MDPKNSVNPTPPTEPQNNTSSSDESREVTVNFNAPPTSAAPMPQPPTPNTSMDSEVSNVQIPNTSLGSSATPPPPPIGPEAQPVNTPYAPQPTITSDVPMSPPASGAQPFASQPTAPGAQPNMGFGGIQGGAPGTTPFQPQPNAPMGQPLGPQPAKGPNKMVFIGLMAVAVILIAAIAVLFLTK